MGALGLGGHDIPTTSAGDATVNMMEKDLGNNPAEAKEIGQARGADMMGERGGVAEPSGAGELETHEHDFSGPMGKRRGGTVRRGKK